MLENADVQMITPDLPSYRTLTAGLAEDAAEVRHPCEPALRQWRCRQVLLAWASSQTATILPSTAVMRPAARRPHRSLGAPAGIALQIGRPGTRPLCEPLHSP
jgi:hypothetical protein